MFKCWSPALHTRGSGWAMAHPVSLELNGTIADEREVGQRTHQ
ncbi:hypothetical protein ACFPT5_12230 [Ornithinimicrobium kibberense]